MSGGRQKSEVDVNGNFGFLAGGGEMGSLLRQTDWHATPLGSPEFWPQSLKTAIRIMLTSRQPIWIGWGQDLLFFYNDPYKTIIGGKHPNALGQPAKVVWQEIWNEIGPMLATAMTGIEGTYVEEQLLIMERNGYPEETYYTFSYSPIPDDSGYAGGIICANTDDTRRVIGERQLTLLRELSARTADARSWRDACGRSVEALATNQHDLPFAILYLADPDSGTFSIAGAAGIKPGHPAAPLSIENDTKKWPIANILGKHEIEVINNGSPPLGNLPTGPWGVSPTQVALIRVSTPAESSGAGVLVVGLNPYRLFDEDYKGFLGLVAGQIGTAISNAEAYEEERRRAEALAEIDRAKTIFFSNISHEFRTPLTLMLGPLEEMLAKRRRDDPSGELPLVDITHRNGLRLLKLVNALLDFSRIEAGRIQMKYETTDISQFTAELASNFRSAMEKAGLDLIVDCPALPRQVYLDRDTWEKIVLNLISNAFKFTLEGGVSVTTRLSPDGNKAELRVSDTGVGIAENELPRLFERFHRVEGSVGRTIEGSGIGLALVQELVKLHGGSIEVTSEIGRGTSFRISIPLGKAHLAGQNVVEDTDEPASPQRPQAFVEEALRWLPDNAAAADPGDLPIAATESAGRRERILIVDDNADLREYMYRLLLADGYRIDTAADGEAALRKIQRKRPSLIISDVMMPRLDGFGLLKALRRDPQTRDISVLLLSAKAGEEARIEGLTAGADDYLTKPFSARELSVRVASNLQLSKLRQETEQKLREDARTLEILNEVGSVVAAELDLNRAVQLVTDAATELTGAAFGSFFYNVINERGESYMLYTLSGVPREAFSKFPMPRNTAVFAPTFKGEAIVRSEDITKDPRFGKNEPHRGMPKGHLPVRSYLASPVTSRTGEVLGGLFFGHPEAGIFTEQHERLVAGIAGQAATAIDNARLYQAAQSEIAERRKAEEALREFNETLEHRVSEAVAERNRLWDLSDDLLVVADYEGRLLRISPSWMRHLGYDRRTLLSTSYFDLLHPDDLEVVTAAFAKLKGGLSSQHENRVRTLEGGWRWIAWTLVNDPSRNRIHGVGRDITADKEAEEAMRHAEAAVRTAQKMEAIGNLTGGIAHDFNNLLQVIGGNLQLLSKEVSGREKAEQRVRNALAGVTRGSKLASQLLSFGRRQPLAPKVVNLGRFIRGLDDLLRRALGEGIEIETVISGGLWNTLVDPFQVENALLNLAINARDAMNGHGKLTIEAGNASLDDDYAAKHIDISPGQYVMVAVTDTGCGMASEVLERAFEPFYTTKPEGQGTGLGLSMVYGFVRQSGGHVKIYSEPDHGTTVRIYLPRMKQDEDLLSETDAGPVTGGTETILVVEDDEDVRNTVVDMLSDLGYRVLKAKDASSGLAIIESGISVDLLFTDIVMPGTLRSPELARKARERLPDIAVLFTSGYTDNAIVHGGQLDEGIELLSKPYRRESLARKLRHVLRNKAKRKDQTIDGAIATVSAPTENADRRALKVLLVEDDVLIRLNTAEMLRELGHEPQEAGDARQALSLLENGPIDVLLTDVHLPDMSGSDLATEARRRLPDVRIVYASGSNPPANAAADFYHLLKPYTQGDLEKALETGV